MSIFSTPPQMRAKEHREAPYGPARCARCRGLMPLGYPGALSRTDNKSEICSDCGTEEALMNMMERPLQPPEDWPLVHIRGMKVDSG